MVIFWVEVSRDVATGHLMQSVVLADKIKERNIPVKFIIPSYPPAEDILSGRGFDFLPVRSVSWQGLEGALIGLSGDRDCVVVNHRSVAAKDLESLRTAGFRTVVIDECGGKKITCDLLVNGSIVKDWFKYEFADIRPRCLFGPDYFIMRDEFTSEAHGEKRVMNDVPKILVSMGGVDRTGATLRVIEALKNVKIPTVKEIILGKGFGHWEMFHGLFMELPKNEWSYASGVDDMARRIASSDLVINSGGNTLYEAACCGTPCLVLWEDPHENIQADSFAKFGCARNLGNGSETPLGLISRAVTDLLGDTGMTSSMRRIGMGLVDGKGSERVADAVVDLIVSRR